MKVIQLVEGSHYTSVKDIQIGGIVMVKHMQTDTEEELVEPVAGEWLISYLLTKAQNFLSEIDFEEKVTLIYFNKQWEWLNWKFRDVKQQFLNCNYYIFI